MARLRDGDVLDGVESGGRDDGSWSHAQQISSLYVHHVPSMVRFAFLLVKDEADAQDIVHSAFIRVASRLNALRSPESFASYLRRAVINEAVATGRSRARESMRVTRALRLHERLGPSSQSATYQVETHLDLLAALQTLSVRQRAAVVLKYWADMTDGQIAEALGWPTGTVKSTLSRAMDHLTKELTSERG